MRLVKGFLGLVALAVPAFADSPDPSQIYIEKIKHTGTGCRPGSVASQISPDAQAFTLLYDDYIVDTSNRGGGHSEDSRPGSNAAQKACNLTIDMHVPAGWSFALFSLDVRGYANLPARVSGFQNTTYAFRGNHKEIGRMELRGPKDEDYFHRTTTSLDQVEFSSCEGKVRVLAIRTSIRVQGKGLLTVDSTDGEVTQKYGIAWRRCANGTTGNNGNPNKPHPHRP
jgi:hypothetical protein